MRRATLYELKATEIVVSGDFFEIARFTQTPYRVSLTDWAAPLSSSVQVDRLPIHCISRTEFIDGVIGSDGYPVRKTEEAYIAIDKALQRKLETPFAVKTSAAESAKAFAEGLVSVIESGHAAWWAQPWYARVWSALKGAGNA